MKTKGLLLISLMLTLMASACAKAQPVESPPQAVEKMVTVVVEEAGARYTVVDASQTLETATQERMIIYTVDIELIVEDAAETMEQIESLAGEMDGYLSDSSSWKDEGLLRARVTLRVPAEKLDETMDRLRGLALDVERESRESQDVTEEFVDLEAQLRNLRVTEEELLELLKTRQETTGETEAILEVHRYLTDIRRQIEQIQGRMNYLSNLSAMATIHVTLTPDALVQPITVGRWQPQGTARQAIRALINALQFLIDALIWILLFVVPVLAVILLPLFLFARFLLRRRRRPTD